jgi:ADP-heptose:LPS heptosyltransferase
VRRVLVVRLDGAGDVVLAGPAVRAVAAAAEVTLLCGPAGAAAGRLLPGVADMLTWACPWVLADPPPVRREDLDAFVAMIAAGGFDAAVVLTSFHQSPLPLALLLRLAGIGSISGASVDYPGALLDVRLRPGEDLDEDQPEPERMLAIARAAGFELPPGDDGALAVLPPPDVTALRPAGPYVVVHPGATAPARQWPAPLAADLVERLARAGRRVLVTGGPDERELTRRVAGATGHDLGGRTDLAELTGLLAAADAVVVGNTGAAHLAAAVGTPVVSLFAPVVPAVRWRPYRVPQALLGDQAAPCRDSRATACPIPGHPCLAGVHPTDVLNALDRLTGADTRPAETAPAKTAPAEVPA